MPRLLITAVVSSSLSEVQLIQLTQLSVYKCCDGNGMVPVVEPLVQSF